MKTKLFLFTIAIFLLQACGSYTSSSIHYSPNEANQLKVIEEKDFKISGSAKNGIGNEDEDRYFSIQAGYSPKQDLGISGGYFLMKPRGPNLFQMVNLSVGKYHLWQPKSGGKKNKYRSSKNEYGQVLMPSGFLVEAYVGVDLGKMKHRRNRHFNINSNFSDSETSRLNLVRYFVRTGVHYQHKLFGISLVSKIGFMDYYKGVLDIEGGSSTGLDRYFEDAIDFNHGFFYEPGFNFHFGTQTIRSYFGGTFSYLFKNDEMIRRKEKLWTIGLVFDIDNLKRMDN